MKTRPRKVHGRLLVPFQSERYRLEMLKTGLQVRRLYSRKVHHVTFDQIFKLIKDQLEFPL